MNKLAYFRRYITKADEKLGSFYPTQIQISRTYNIINDCIFDGKLRRPKIILKYMPDAWGICQGDLDDGSYPAFKPRCNYIALNNSFDSYRHFIEVLAHEMVHQYQCEHLNKMDHGKTFWAWKVKFARYNMRLSIKYGKSRRSTLSR